MNETRLKILSALLFLAVLALTLDKFGVFTPDAGEDPLCSDGEGLSAERISPPVRQQSDLSALGLADRASTLPATPVGQAMEWALSTINTGTRTLSTDDLTDRFAPPALERIPVAELRGAMITLAANGPYVLVGTTAETTETSIRGVVQGADFRLYNLEGSVEAEAPHRVLEFRISARD